MFFYFIYLVFLAILCGRYSIANGKRLLDRELGFKVAILTIIFVSAMRFNIGYDWSAYFSWIYPKFKPFAVESREPLTRWIYYTANFFNQPWIVFFLYALIIYGTVGQALQENSSCKYESLIIYMALFYFMSLSSIRQHAAVGITLVGLRYIKEKKPLKYFLVCIIAMLAHKSAILAVLVYPLYYVPRKYSLLPGIVLFIGFKFVVPIILGSVFSTYLMYLDSGVASNSGNLMRLFYTVLLLYAILFIDKRNQGYFNICLIGVVLMYCLGGMTGERAGRYFLIYFILLMPEVNKRFTLNYRILFLIPFYVYFFLYIYTAVTKNHSTEFIPFRWYFLEDLNQPIS